MGKLFLDYGLYIIAYLNKLAKHMVFNLFLYNKN